MFNNIVDLKQEKNNIHKDKKTPYDYIGLVVEIDNEYYMLCSHKNYSNGNKNNLYVEFQSLRNGNRYDDIFFNDKPEMLSSFKEYLKTFNILPENTQIILNVNRDR